MKLYLMSLGVGLLVGILYALLNVCSPAPPVIALVGLLGILIGEQIPPLVNYLRQALPEGHSWLHQLHVLGHLPSGTQPSPTRIAHVKRGSQSSEK